MIDGKLNGMAHCAYNKKLLTNYVKATHSLTRRIWSLSGDVLKHLYKGGIERLATYACSFWWTLSARMPDSLVSSQRPALLAITLCSHTTSTAALQVLAGTLPLDLYAACLQAKGNFLGRALILGENMSIDDIFISADEVELKAER